MRALLAETIWLARLVGATVYDLYNVPLSMAEEALRDRP